MPTIWLLTFPTFVLFAGVSSDEYGNRPRGVSSELASFYAEREEFQCLDGKQKIPFDHINDDYCDCADGSDEPGTAACPNGSFYCKVGSKADRMDSHQEARAFIFYIVIDPLLLKNLGFRPLILPSSRVNDYICDCCDGSDEWDSGVECPNLCAEHGVKAREEAKQLRSVHAAGYAKRVELAKNGLKALEAKRAEVEKHKRELEELSPTRADLEEKKNQAEEKESEAKKKHEEEWNVLKEKWRSEAAKITFSELDKDKNEILMPSELTGNPTTEEKDSAVIKEIFGELEETGLAFSDFLKSFDKIRDYIRRSRAAKRLKEQGSAEDDGKSTMGEKEDQEHLDASREIVDGDDDDEEEGKERKGEKEAEPPRPPYNEEAQRLIDEAEAARKTYHELLDKVSDLESTIKGAESFLEFDYGPDHAWAPLKGECAELTTHQYTYRLCPFEKAVQKDRNGHSEVNLGYWGKWSGPEAADKYAAQLYDHGQSCWNGPERSTKVEIQCGEQLQLIDTAEPAKCEYKFLLKAPPACRNPDEMEREHQEL